MKIVVFGEKGFIGHHVANSCRSAGHDVISTYINNTPVNLLIQKDIQDFLYNAKPEVIINCAGIVSGGDVFDDNRLFSLNILKAINAIHLSVKNMVIIGSAAEYGIVNFIPVNEHAELRGVSEYAKSKIQESNESIEYAKSHNINIVIARMFNPIGKNMKPKFLLPSIVHQLSQLHNNRKIVEVNRMDTKRDYIDVRDAADAICILATDTPEHTVYNIGSGKSVNTKMLIDELASIIGVNTFVIRESSQSPEPLYAVQADIDRIKNEFGWAPSRDLTETLQWVVKS